MGKTELPGRSAAGAKNVIKLTWKFMLFFVFVCFRRRSASYFAAGAGERATSQVVGSGCVTNVCSLTFFLLALAFEDRFMLGSVPFVAGGTKSEAPDCKSLV